jgi:glycosyltransferase involved in cell wall biosynthesis
MFNLSQLFFVRYQPLHDPQTQMEKTAPGAAPDRSRTVAIVCDTVPFPARSGDNKRISDMIQALRTKGWVVHLVLSTLVDRPARQLCRRQVDQLHVYTGRGFRTRSRNLLRLTARFCDRIGNRLGYPPLEDTAARILGRPLGRALLDYWQRYPTGLDEFLARLYPQCQWRAVLVEYVWLHRAIDKLPAGILRILDTHDIQHRRVEEYASRGLSFPLKITRDQEARIFSRFDAVIAIQSQEAALVREMCPGLQVLTVGTACADLQQLPSNAVPGRVLYVGGYNGANVEGLNRFLRNCWPEIRRACPHAHLNVCGHIYRAFPAGQFPRVNFLGHVIDIRSQYSEAELVVNPVWIGTGLKIKTVEAVASGKPLVTTNKGIEGMPSGIEKACIIAPLDRDFSDGVIRLLTDAEMRLKTANAASVFADGYLTAYHTYNELFEFLHGDT